MQNGTATLEDSLVVYYKTKHTLTIQPNNLTPWYLPKGAENYAHTETCIQALTEALFIITKTGK